MQVLNGLRDLIQSIYDALTLSTQEAKYNNLLNKFGENRNGAGVWRSDAVRQDTGARPK